MSENNNRKSIISIHITILIIIVVGNAGIELFKDAPSIGFWMYKIGLQFIAVAITMKIIQQHGFTIVHKSRVIPEDEE